MRRCCNDVTVEKKGRYIYADSFFANVALGKLLYKKFNMLFQGVFKQCSSLFPKRVLEIALLSHGQGETKSTIGTIPWLIIKLIALLWRDCTKRTLISSRVATDLAKPIVRIRLRKYPKDKLNGGMVRIEQSIPHTEVSAARY